MFNRSLISNFYLRKSPKQLQKYYLKILFKPPKIYLKLTQKFVFTQML